METLSVGQLANLCGVNAQTVHFYEREGLLPKPPRTAGGYRAFPADAVARVCFIKQAQAVGFALEEVRELLELRNHPETACPEVQRRADAKIADVAAKIRDLQNIRRELTRLAKACAGRAKPHSCPLLEALEKGAKAHKAFPTRRSQP